jgi:membrane-associated phospholipid phosphatase
MKELFYNWGGANVWLFHGVNNLHFALLDRLMQLGTLLGDHQNFTLYVSLVALMAVMELASSSVQDPLRYQAQVKRWVATVAVLCVAYLLDGWVIGALKPLLDFPRPLLALPEGAVFVVGQPEYHHSLPSGHSAFAMLIVASLWPVLNRDWRILGVCFVVWVGLSRISLGAHFPADVLAGFGLGLIVVVLVRIAVQALLRRFSKES